MVVGPKGRVLEPDTAHNGHIQDASNVPTASLGEVGLPSGLWVENDLIDLLFLSCAAAYADFVFAERKATHLLRLAARRASSGATVFATLYELCHVLDS